MQLKIQIILIQLSEIFEFLHFKSRIFKIEKEKLQVKSPTNFDVPKSIQIIIIISF